MTGGAVVPSNDPQTTLLDQPNGSPGSWRGVVIKGLPKSDGSVKYGSWSVSWMTTGPSITPGQTSTCESTPFRISLFCQPSVLVRDVNAGNKFPPKPSLPAEKIKSGT